MKKYVIFSFFIQVLILLISLNLYYEPFNIKLLISFIFIGIIYIPSFLEFFSGNKIKNSYHYLFTTIIFIIFIILIDF